VCEEKIDRERDKEMMALAAVAGSARIPPQPVPPFISSQRKEISLRLHDMLDLKGALLALTSVKPATLQSSRIYHL
jgi:hypothetical protein